MKSINLRFLLASLVCFSVLGVAAVMVHAVQLRWQSAFLLERARKSRDEQQFAPALRDYQLYLQLAPKNVEARAEFGLLLADCGQAPAAVVQLEAALRELRDRDDLRRRLVDLDIALQRYSDAQEHLQVLLAVVRNDGNLWEQLGICQNARGVYQSPPGADPQSIQSFGAAESFQRAIALDSTRCESYDRLAEVLRLRLDRAKEADDWMEKLVSKNADSAMAHFFRARYLHWRTKNQENLALREAEKSAELAKNSPKSDAKDLHLNALLLAAELAEQAADYVKARSYSREVIAVDPALYSGYLALFRIEIHAALLEQDSATSLAHRETAVDFLRQGIEKSAQRGQLLWALGRYMIEQRERHLDEARKAAELDEARKVVAELRGLPEKERVEPVLVDLLQAEIETAQGHWCAACSILEDVAQQLELPKKQDGVDGRPQQGSALELLKEADYRLVLLRATGRSGVPTGRISEGGPD